MSFIPSTIKSQLVSNLLDLNDKSAFLRDQNSSYKKVVCTAIVETVEKGLRECYAREILAYHEVECKADNYFNSCTCRDIADMIIGEILGDEIGEFKT